MYCQVIASAAKEVLSIENNVLRDCRAMDCLLECGIDYVPCSGMYEGVQESSFFINVQDTIQFDILKAVFFGRFDQESILVIIGGEGSLLFKDGTTECLGEFKEVCKTEAERNGAYTYMDRRYFVCKALTTMPEWGTCSEETKQAESEMAHPKDHPCSECWKCNPDLGLLADVEI